MVLFSNKTGKWIKFKCKRLNSIVNGLNLMRNPVIKEESLPPSLVTQKTTAKLHFLEPDVLILIFTLPFLYLVKFEGISKDLRTSSMFPIYSSSILNIFFKK